MAAAKPRVTNPPEPPKVPERPKGADVPTEKPRRTMTVAGKRYVLVNGGWRRG